MTRAMEHCDKGFMEHYDDKGMEPCDENDHGAL